jgi:AbrB family looped-hinge helix DNA binding protein
MLASTMTIKGQTTIPAEVRKSLDLHPGDLVSFEIIDHKAVISKVSPFDQAYHKALSKTLSEWDSIHRR